MDPAVQAFKDKMAEKAAAKQKALAAAGEARFVELQGRDASAFWDVVADYGIDGAEGRAFAEMQHMADAYVEANPGQFTAVEHLVTPEGNEQLVLMIAALGKAGQEEYALKLTMFELATFDRQQFGVTPKPALRLVNGG